MSSGAYAGIRAVDVRFQFRDQIRNSDEKLHTGLAIFFGKTRIEFSDSIVRTLWCNVYFSFSMFCINHGDLEMQDQDWSLTVVKNSCTPGLKVKITPIFDKLPATSS